MWLILFEIIKYIYIFSIIKSCIVILYKLNISNMSLI